MKLAKVLPAMAALVVLSACASEAPKVENKAEQTAAPTLSIRKPRANSGNGDGG